MKDNNLKKQIDIHFKNWILLSNYNYKNVYDSFVFIFKNNSVNLNKIKRNSFFNIYVFDEFYFADQKKIISLLNKFQNNFEIININRHEVLIFFENRLFKIYFKKIFPKKIYSIKSYLIYFYKIKYMYSPNYIWTYLNNYLSNIFQRNKTYLLTYEDFLKLNMKNKGISKDARQGNMNLVTNNGKNTSIKDIINFFKKEKNRKKFSKVYFNKNLFYNSLNSKIPIHLNLNYWNSSNFYLISNIMYGFYDKKFQYESQTLENNFYKIFSSKLNLIKKKNKIIKLVNSCDLIIINNNPYSSRNRLLAMIGHVLKGGEYIKFRYKKYFDQNIYKQKLINLFAEHFSVYNYNSAKIFNLDSNYKKIFEDRGIQITYGFDIKPSNNKLEVNFIMKNYYKKFKFIEVNTLLDLPPVILNLIFIKKNKASYFYLDIKNNSTYLNKNFFLRHAMKILLTIIKLKPKILIVIE